MFISEWHQNDALLQWIHVIYWTASPKVYLSQQHYPLAIRPDDVVHLRAHSLPGQLRSPQARLQDEHNIMSDGLFPPLIFCRAESPYVYRAGKRLISLPVQWKTTRHHNFVSELLFLLYLYSNTSVSLFYGQQNTIRSLTKLGTFH